MYKKQESDQRVFRNEFGDKFRVNRHILLAFLTIAFQRC